MAHHSDSSSYVVRLNIGGKKFCTTLDTLMQREPDSMLAAMFSGCHTICQESEKGYIFVDRDGKHFRHILNWLRDGVIPPLKDSEYAQLLREAEYYQLLGLVDVIKAALSKRKEDEELGTELTRIDIIKCIQSDRVRFRGINLSGLDLSKLGYIFVDRDGKHFRHILNWLRDGVIPPLKDSEYAQLLREAEYYQLLGLVDVIKAALSKRKEDEELGTELTRIDIIKCIQSDRVRFRGINLSGLDLSKLDLSFVDFSYACLKTVFFSRANLQCAKFRYRKEEEVMEMGRCEFTGANLRGAVLAGANLQSANLQDACLIGCSFCGADLRSAHLQGAKLTNANLKGANLQRAYLRHVNLRDTGTPVELPQYLNFKLLIGNAFDLSNYWDASNHEFLKICE
ncbi:hypothetical protein RND71_036312 [Anisodus tanguticus]|uniref:BTB domain-containing protein n=1 Tax=Anisodus tanguticus TaxID=243964 RepID=A0AAE1V0I0_9SOLA|nr:hypothetical protein RND71_036312 [Anisodus tanguticus]